MIKGRDWNSLTQNFFNYLQMKYIQSVEKTKFTASKKAPSNSKAPTTPPPPHSLPSSQNPPKPGLEAGLKIKPNCVQVKQDLRKKMLYDIQLK